MKKIWAGLAGMAAFLFVFLASPLPVLTEDRATVSGEWGGRWWARSGSRGYLELSLKQEGESVTGTLTSTSQSRPPIINAPVNGAIKGNRLSLKIPATDGFVEATVEGSRMEGKVKGRGNVPADFSAVKR